MAFPQICTEVPVPPNLRAQADMFAVRENPRNGTQITSGNSIPGVGKMGLALPVGRMWRTGRTLRVKILNGSEKIRSKVPQYANVWSEHSNIKFDFVDSGNAEIRVNIDSSGSSWSNLGTDCLSVPADQPTMNFGWLKDSTPEREFSPFDQSSIMVYAIPSSMTTNGYSTAANDYLSETNKSFIANAYPTEARGLSAFNTMEVRAWDKPAKTASKRQIFSQEFDTPPKLAVGLNWLDVANATNIRVHAYADKLSKASADVHIDTWHDTTLYSAGCTWFTASQSRDPDFQVGEFSTHDDHAWDKPQPNTPRRISFERPYHAPPKVVVWLNQLDMAHDKNWRVMATATDVDAKGFTLHLDTWSNTTLYAAKAAWIAYPADKAGVASGSYSTEDVRPWDKPQLENAGKANFPAGAFRDTPKVLIALNSLDIDCGKNLRLKLSADSVSKDGMTWHIDSWYDTKLYMAAASYIAFT
ncbi:hypothetical protein RB594_009147 [Gaeumannomyces avenae]